MNMIYKCLKDYTPTDFLVGKVELHFEIYEDYTLVTSKTQYSARQDSVVKDLVLNGESMELIKVDLISNQMVQRDISYVVDDKLLTIKNPPKNFDLVVVTKLRPESNRSLEGLYRSGDMFCTQCEAEGFRKITYFYDRPDIMALEYLVHIDADVKKYPVMLSNGNLVGKGQVGDRQWITWRDPIPKPCYLFALVVGNLGCLRDHFVTRSGREVSLEIYADKDQIDSCHRAMDSLKSAMKWDEERFNLECDLDSYKIVAVNDFNAGAMENKGLNIFNSVYVLAQPHIATDSDYDGITGVIGHEYFHNWTGNRITCRDWFQLCLKEGLTVFRDQEFSSDVGSREVERIKEVRYLKMYQFPEDSGPMSHPPRPDKYMEINNFYTATVYRKGAEIVRMMHTLVGEEAFQKGMALYVKRHDGQAVTQEDFVSAMSDGSGVDLSPFMDWYTQAGTPNVEIRGSYDVSAQRYILDCKQSEPCKWIPLKISLLDKSTGALQPLSAHKSTESTLVLKSAQETFYFDSIKKPVVPSLFRNFSAPVKWTFDYSLQDLQFLMVNDTDAYNVWDASQRIFLHYILKLSESRNPSDLDPTWIEAFGDYLKGDQENKHLKSFVLSLPSEHLVAQAMKPIDVDGLSFALDFVEKKLAKDLRNDFLEQYLRYHRPQDDALQTEASKAYRAYKNTCLTYLSACGQDAEVWALTLDQLFNSKNMTDIGCALKLVANSSSLEKEEIFQKIYHQWKHNPLLLDRWFSFQAEARSRDVVFVVKKLIGHPDFNKKNPNRLRALLRTFIRDNMTGFHRISGEGYELCAEQVVDVDSFNPQMAAGLVGPLGRWRDFDVKRQSLMREALKKILHKKDLSPDVQEVVARSLQTEGL